MLVRFCRRLLLLCPLLWTLAFAVSAFADTLLCRVHFCGHTFFVACPPLRTPCFCPVHFCGHTFFVACPPLRTPCFCPVHFCGHPAIYCLSTFVDTLFLFLVRFCGYLLFVLLPVSFCGHPAFAACPLLWTPYFAVSAFADACFCPVHFCGRLLLLPVHFCGHPAIYWLSAFVDTLLCCVHFCGYLTFAVFTFVDACFCPVHFCGHLTFALSTFVDIYFYYLSSFVDTLFFCLLLRPLCNIHAFSAYFRVLRPHSASPSILFALFRKFDLV